MQNLIKPQLRIEGDCGFWLMFWLCHGAFLPGLKLDVSRGLENNEI